MNTLEYDFNMHATSNHAALKQEVEMDNRGSDSI